MAVPLPEYRIRLTARIGIDELRSYVVRTFEWETWRQTSAQLQETINHIRQFPASGHAPAELEGFLEDGSGKHFRARTGSFIRFATIPFSFIS